MAGSPEEQDIVITISSVEEELRQITDLQLSSSSESDILSEEEDGQEPQLEAEDETERTCEEWADEAQEGKLNTGDVQVGTDASCGDHRVVGELKEKIQKLSEEKKQIASELQELKIQTKKLNKQLENERLEKEAICVKLGKNLNKYSKLNRVSLAVAQEYADALDKLDLEQSLRYEAESYASKVLTEQKAISRQSMILMQNIQPDVMLIKALDDVRSLTMTLEETKRELQSKIESLQLQFEEDLKVANSEKGQLEEELKVTKEKCTLLEDRVKSLEEELQRHGVSVKSSDDMSVVAPPVSPPPPPPPAPPPPLINAPIDPLALTKQRRGLLESKESKEPKESPAADDSPKADAMNQMMERIRGGVKLRPTRNVLKDQMADNSKRKSVINQLQEILMDSARKPIRRASRRRISRRGNDSQLQSILQRRRRIVDTPPTAEREIVIRPERLKKVGLPKDSKGLAMDGPAPVLMTPLDIEMKLRSEKQIKKPFI